MFESMTHKEEICEKKIPDKVDNTKNVKAEKGLFIWGIYEEYVGAKKLVLRIQKCQRYCLWSTKGIKAISDEIIQHYQGITGVSLLVLWCA